MAIILLVPLALLGGYLTLYVVYQAALFAANALIPDPPVTEPSRFRRFNIVIPAHNEELHLPRLLASVTTQDYPTERFRAAVIADNCTDGTVAACAGYDVDVFERHDPANRGKGHALKWALDHIGIDRYDALVIVDGDSMIAPGFLRHLNLQMERGDRVIQCYNGVANPGQSWFTRLMDVSRTMANEIVHPGKRKLGLSSHLMGNGMCFDVRILQSTGWNALSVGEDWEYYAQLVIGGAYVGYSKGSRVYHQESVSLRQASTQRMRWSSGRFDVLKRYGSALFIQGLRTRNLRCLDAALPLVFPNPSLGINLTLLGLIAASLAVLFGASTATAIWFAVLALAQFGMLIVGVWHTKHKAASAASLVLAPLFLVWKMGIDILSVFGIGKHEWKQSHRRAS
jgi:cellulose synthase/poly-beta-1,6-N-acetylglucosamine synthase-like glycosyltransferase